MTDEIDPSMEGTAEDSPVVKALRAQIRDLEKDLRARPERVEVESQIRAQLKRESDAAALLIELGQPGGLSEFMLSKIGDQELNTDSVSRFLQGLGLDTQPVSDETVESSPTQSLAGIADLASKVSAAAQGVPADSVMDRIAKANTTAEINAIMQEIGAVQSQTF